MIPPKDLQRMKAWQQSGGNLPLDGRRVATYQDQNASDSSYDSASMSERNYPWYPSSAGGGNMPPGMANYYSDYLQNQRMPRGGSAPYFHPFESSVRTFVLYAPRMFVLGELRYVGPLREIPSQTL